MKQRSLTTDITDGHGSDEESRDRNRTTNLTNNTNLKREEEMTESIAGP